MLPVAALLIGGCGGGGSSNDVTVDPAGTTIGALTKAELIEKGDAICAEVNAAVGKVKPGSPRSAARLARLYSGMIESLKKLGIPAETEAKYGEYLYKGKLVVIADDEVERAAKLGESAALETAHENAESALSAFELRAYWYGFKECSRTPNAPPSSAVPYASDSAEEAEAAEAERK